MEEEKKFDINITKVFIERNRKPKNIRQYVQLTSYDEWIQTIQPLDLIAFGPTKCTSCQDGVSKCLVCCQAMSLCDCSTQWAHVGLVLPGFMLDFPNKQDTEMYILESVVSGQVNCKCIRKVVGTDNVLDVTTGHGSNGVQIRVLRDVVHAYQGQIALVHILPELLKPIQEVRNKLQIWWNEYQHTQFDFIHCFQAICWIPCSTCCVARNGAMFCSEMATHIYQYLGWIICSIIPEMVSPQDLVEYVGPLVYTYDIFQPISHVLTKE